MKNEVLLALILKHVESKLEKEFDSRATLLRGPRGPKGLDGESFNFDEHSDKIKSWVKECSLKFSDLSVEELETLRGPQGKSGRDGKNFSFEENSEEILGHIKSYLNELKPELKLQFSDLAEDDIKQLRGPKGERGATGKDFVFSENEKEISGQIKSHLEEIKPDLSLKFENLTEEQKLEIRGPRGQRGRQGRDFVFEDHIEFFRSLKLKFTDLSPEEISELRLKFENLTDEEKSSLKLKFTDLTDDEKFQLRGARGQRGRNGIQGPQGEIGEQGPQGLIGPQGEKGDRGDRGVRGPIGFGAQGPKGDPGQDGEDSPKITSIDLKEDGKFFNFEFYFSDGTKISTDNIKIPTSKEVYVVGGGIVSGSGSGSGGTSDFAYLFGAGAPINLLGVDGNLYQDTANGDQYKKISGAWALQTNLTGPQGPAGTNGTNGTNGVSPTVTVGTTTTGAPGSMASVTNSGIAPNVVLDFTIPRGDAGSGGSGSTNLLVDVPCETDVYIGSVVRMKYGAPSPAYMSEWTSMSLVSVLDYNNAATLAGNALADSYENSNVVGVVEAKSAPGLCNIRTYGITPTAYLGLDIVEEYYLSDTTPGAIVPSFSAPTATGTILLKIGQPFSGTQFLVNRGERLVRA